MGIQSRKSSGHILGIILTKVVCLGSLNLYQGKRPPQLSRMLIGGGSFFCALVVFISLAFGAGQSPIPKMKLYREFKKAQAEEMKDLDKELQAEKKELKNSQAQRKKDWENEAKLERHQYFKDNTEPKKRKEYIQEFMKKREAFKQAFSDELKEQKQDHTNRKKALQMDHSQKHAEFKSALERGEEPNPDLWPEKVKENFLKSQATTESKSPPKTNEENAHSGKMAAPQQSF